MRQPGQNIVEYSIVIGLVAIVSVGGLLLFGQNMSQGLGDTLAVGQSGNPVATGFGSGTPSNPPNTSSGLPGQLVTIDLGNGKSIQFTYAEPVAVAEALGPLGTTDNAVAAIRQIIEQLRAQGADPNTINQFEELANKAHDIRQIQEAIKNATPDHAIGSNDEWAAYADGIQIRMHNGEMKTLREATTLLGAQNGLNFELQQQNLIDGSYNRWTQEEIDNSPLLTYMSTLQGVNELPEVQNSPALRALLNNVFSSQIYSSSGSTFTVAYNGGDLTGYINTVRQNANNICTIGQGTTCQDQPG